MPAVTNDAEAGKLATTLFGPGSDYLTNGQIAESDLDVVVALYNESRGTSVTPASVRSLIDTQYLPSTPTSRAS